ncbi:MAG: peroxiredoxin [Gammaproteobacteria bacterium]
MAGISVGAKVAAFKAPSTGGRHVRLADYKGRNLIVYFYPKDNTPGCTVEGQDFRDNIRRFSARNTAVLGVSRDSLKSHESFREKHGFPFDLISDAEEELCRLFGVIKEKNMYGKKFLGIERSTFLIDANGVLRREWRGVRVDGHVDDVLQAIKEL